MSELSDHHVRDRVAVSGLDETLFVEAGAGTGKTTLLVERITNLVLEADVSLRSIAAITFTEAAAAELQSRIRAAFEKAKVAAEAKGDVVRAARCAHAIDETDLAAITTLHGFANRVLGEFSVAAGLPPRVRVLDEVSSQLAHEDRWQRFVDRLYDGEHHEDLLVMAAALDIGLEPRYPGHTTLRDVAVEFNQNWDRLGALATDDVGALPAIDFSGFDQAVDELASWIPQCLDPDDKLLAHLHRVVPEMRAIVNVDDPYRKLRLLAQRRPKSAWWGRTSFGKKEPWQGRAPDVKQDISAVNQAVVDCLEPITDAVLTQLASLVAREIVAAAETRRVDGGLEFHDLLVLARELLRSNTEARAVLHDRYTHVLLDEFQDTDPIQIELAVLIATHEADVVGRSWTDMAVAPGRLFFVGDPKQSIYRFRRADISLFLAARDRFAGDDGSLQLTTNFRTTEPIVDWVNAMFSSLMADEQPGRQPRYEPLVAFRRPDHTTTDGEAPHTPILLGGPHADPKVRSAELRAAEAADVVRMVQAIIDSPDAFPIEEASEASSATGGGRIWRAAELDDITILVPTRTSLPFLKAELDEAGIRYRIATGTLVYETQEVVDALAAMRAIDDPTDAISLVTALRSPLYACSDVDLFTWRSAGGRWDLRQQPPEGLDSTHPVAEAFSHLESLWSERWFLTPSQVLERLLRERKATLLAFGTSRPSDVWRRLRFVLEQARAFEESSSAGLRAFTEWAMLQGAPMARVHEPLLPETDEKALSIQTIHGSKGLEFPITILSGMTTQMTARRNGVSVLWDDVDAPQIKMRSGVETMRHEPRADLENEMDEYERHRLAYVAATRARDHLIVSCHHKANQKDTTYGGLFHSVFDARDTSGLIRRIDPDDFISDAPPPVPPPSQLGLALDDRRPWIERHNDLFATTSSRVISATAIATRAQGDTPGQNAGLLDQDDDGADQQTDSAVPIRRRGRTGSAIGSAVHGVLQLVDLGDPADLDDVVRQQADAEGVTQHAFVVGQLVRAALDAPAAGLASRHRHHKELFVAAPVGDRVVEGYVDLLVEGPDGLIVVDWKTDNVRSEAEIEAKLESYELQAAAYAVALESVTGIDVVECRFVFLRTSGADERTVRDLPRAMQRVRETVAQFERRT